MARGGRGPAEGGEGAAGSVGPRGKRPGGAARGSTGRGDGGRPPGAEGPRGRRGDARQAALGSGRAEGRYGGETGPGAGLRGAARPGADLLLRGLPEPAALRAACAAAAGSVPP